MSGVKPPRHKMALVVWLAIFPSVTVALTLMRPLIEGLPVVLQSFALTVIVVPIAVMIIIPWLTRMLGGWLNR